jgi:hypothetical protein
MPDRPVPGFLVCEANMSVHVYLPVYGLNIGHKAGAVNNYFSLVFIGFFDPKKSNDFKELALPEINNS